MKRSEVTIGVLKNRGWVPTFCEDGTEENLERVLLTISKIEYYDIQIVTEKQGHSLNAFANVDCYQDKLQAKPKGIKTDWSTIAVRHYTHRSTYQGD